MNTRLVRETSCVHGYFQDCTFLLDSGEPCPGGTSREVEVDYEAALEACSDVWPYSRITQSDVDVIVDAALRGGW